MNHEISCCDLCGNVVSINGRKTRAVCQTKIEISGWRYSQDNHRSEAFEYASVHKRVCEECQESMKPLGEAVHAWLKSRTGINAAEITVKERSKV